MSVESQVGGPPSPTAAGPRSGPHPRPVHLLESLLVISLMFALSLFYVDRFPHAAGGWVQSLTVLAIILYLIWSYGLREDASFLKPLSFYLHDNLIQALLLVVVVGLAWGVLLPSLGLPDLIWSAKIPARIGSAAGATLVLALLGINAYYLNPVPVRATELISAYQRRYGMNLPFELGLEPSKPRGKDLSLFLRTARFPFLTLLALPVLFPLAFPFSAVPRMEPGTTGGPPYFAAHVSHSVLAQFRSVSFWMAGLAIGVFAIKLAFLAGDRLSDFTDTMADAMNGITQEVGRQWRQLTGPFAGWFYDPEEPETDGSRSVEGSLRSDLDPRGSTPRVGEARSDAWKDQARSLLAFVSVATLFYVALSTFAYSYVPPGLAVFALIGFLSMVNALFRKLVPPRLRLATVALASLWIVWANGSYFKLQFDNLAYDDKTRPKLIHYDPRLPVSVAKSQAKPAVGPIPGPDLVDNRASLDRWLGLFKGREGKPKLAIVCASGGGVRASLWSSAVLDWLDRELDAQDFRRSLRLISASSASAVGASYYVKQRYDGSPWTITRDPDLRLHDDKRPDNTIEKRWSEKVPIDSLEPVGRSLALREVWRMFSPGRGSVPQDRGKELEASWGQLRMLTLDELREAEREAIIPSLVFSPLILEDGRRLLISNLDFATHATVECSPPGAIRDLAVHKGRELIFDPKLTRAADPPSGPTEVDRLIHRVRRGTEFFPDDTPGVADLSVTLGMKPGDSVFSVTSTEFAKVFAREKGFRLATGARMSATFPFVTPAVYLPTDPPVRIIDSGYRDNYGVDVAASWVFQNREWLQANTSGVVVVQVRSMGATPELRLGVPETGEAGWSPFKGFQLLTSVLEAAGQTFSSSAIFRNDQSMALLCELLNPKAGSSSFFTTVVFDLPVVLRHLPDREGWPIHPLPKGWEDWGAYSGPLSWSYTEFEARAIWQGALLTEETARRFGRHGDENREARMVALRALSKQLTTARGQEASTLQWEYERAVNFEKLQALKAWWGTSHTPNAPCQADPPDHAAGVHQP